MKYALNKVTFIIAHGAGLYQIALGMLAFLLFSSLLSAQGSDHTVLMAENDSVGREIHRKEQGLALLEQISKDADHLAPENRIAIKSAVVDLLWQTDPVRARVILPSLVRSLEVLVSANTGTEGDDDRDRALRRKVDSLRLSTIQWLGTYDTPAALRALAVTRPTAFPDRQAENEDRFLESALARNLRERDSAPAAPLVVNQADNSDQRLEGEAQASADIRQPMSSQPAYLSAPRDDVRRHQIIEEGVTDPVQRSQVLDNLEISAAMNDASLGNIALARSLASNISSKARRMDTLIQIATCPGGKQQRKVVLEILEDVSTFLSEWSQSPGEFNMQLRLAQAFISLDQERSTRIFARTAQRLNNILRAAAEVDSYLPKPSFHDGELELTSGHLYSSLVQPFNTALLVLAEKNPEAAKLIAGALELPEVRACANLAIAKALLRTEPASGIEGLD